MRRSTLALMALLFCIAPMAFAQSADGESANEGVPSMRDDDVASAPMPFPSAEEEASAKPVGDVGSAMQDGSERRRTNAGEASSESADSKPASLEDQAFQPATDAELRAATTPIDQDLESNQISDEGSSYLPDVLNIVMGLLLIAIVGGGLIWLYRRSPKMKRYFSGGPIHVLSRAYLGPKYAVVLVKVGERLLVVGQSPDGLNTLSEITSRDEVMRLMADVESEQPDSASQTFASVLREAGRSRDDRPASSADLKRAEPVAPLKPRPSAGFELVEDSDVRDAAAGTSKTPADSSASPERLAAIRHELEKQKARLNP